ncbi:MAG: hypothetical protein HY242_09770 [Afipia sp.]|nr:hypothetical protein [Afipia sp.]
MRLGQRRLVPMLAGFGILAGVSGFATAADSASECLSGPKGVTPQGKHWYYRIEHPSKRHCWYLGDEGRRTVQETAAAQQAEPSQPQKPPPKRNSEQLEPAVANARAEVTKDVAVPFTTMPPIAPPSAPDPRPNEWKLAERWPDNQSQVQVAQAATPLPPPAPAQSRPMQRTVASANAAAPAAASEDDVSDGLRIVLGILTAAIALGAIIGRLILSHMKPKRRPAQRRAIWQSVDEESLAPVYARIRQRDPSLRAQAEQDVEELLRALRYPETPRTISQAVSVSRGRRQTGPSGARA